MKRRLMKSLVTFGAMSGGHKGKITSPGLAELRLGHQLGAVLCHSSLRLCLVRRRLHRVRVIDVTTVPMDGGAVESWSGKIDAAAAIITGYLDERGLRHAPVNVGLLGDDIAIRRLSLPEMSKKELSAAVIWEGRKLFPFDLNQCLIEYQPVDARGGNRPAQVAVNITAARREVIEAIYDRFHSAGLRLGQVNFLPAMMAANLPALTKGQDEERRLILFLDDEQSLAVFTHHDAIEFFQQFVTNPSLSPDSDDEVANIEAVTAELSTFFDLYNGQGFGRAVERIVLCGRYADNDALTSAIEENTGLSCRPILDRESLPAVVQAIDPRKTVVMADVVSVGLALTNRHVLVPDAVRNADERRDVLVRVGAAAVLALLIVGNLHVQELWRARRLESELASKKVIAAAIENSPGYRGYINLVGKLDRSRAYLAEWQEQHKSHYHLMLKELSRTLPDDVTLRSISLAVEDSGYVVNLEGSVRLRGFAPEIILAQYVEMLYASPFFDNVTVARYVKKREVDRFDLSFQLKMGARV